MLNKRGVNSKSSKDPLISHDEIPAGSDDPRLNVLHKSIRFGYVCWQY
ncbi:hypothetical protein [Marinobacter sp. ELB17]|nr:hypothetical protein [Marinobacter sp. ELB17]EAZ98848.1 hypothetical protein MELB17_15092 [Marinobacter sp. ELB17]